MHGRAMRCVSFVKARNWGVGSPRRGRASPLHSTGATEAPPCPKVFPLCARPLVSSRPALRRAAPRSAAETNSFREAGSRPSAFIFQEQHLRPAAIGALVQIDDPQNTTKSPAAYRAGGGATSRRAFSGAPLGQGGEETRRNCRTCSPPARDADTAGAATRRRNIERQCRRTAAFPPVLVRRRILRPHRRG